MWVTAGIALALALVWLVVARWCWRVYHNPRRPGDVLSGAAWSAVRLYARLFHGLRVRGRGHIPAGPVIGGRPVVVVCNHTAGLDPLLVQAAVPFFVRWMMAQDMRGGPWLDDLWRFTGAIMVDRSGKPDPAAIRAAMETMAAAGRPPENAEGAEVSGAALGVFPEGALRRHPEELREFHAGIGLMVSRGRAIVLPAVIRGTPHCHSSWASLWVPSRSSVEFHAPIDYAALGLKAGQIAPDLRSRFAGWLGVRE